MAGSWYSAVNEDGQLLGSDDLRRNLLDSDELREFAEQAYGMIWYMANRLSQRVPDGRDAEENVLNALLHYKGGVELSPGLADGEEYYGI